MDGRTPAVIMTMDGNRAGSRTVDVADVLSDFQVAPTSMTMMMQIRLIMGLSSGVGTSQTDSWM